MEATTLELSETNQMPKFLKVLCILSFIMCGIMLLFALIGLKNLFMTPEEILGMNPYMQTMQDNNPEAYQAMLDSMQYKNVSAILGVIMPIISLFGVIFMWKRKKSGFYIYLVGEFLPYLTIFLTNGLATMYAATSQMGENGTMAINIFIGMVIFFDLLFVVLYGLNFKHLK